MPLKDPEKRRQYEREYNRERRKKNPEYHRRYYIEHREHCLQYNRERREHRREYMREWRKRNPEYFQRTKDKVYKQRKIRRDESSPEMRLYRNVSGAIWLALKQNKAGRRWEILVGYTLQDLIRHLETLMDEKMNWGNYGIYWWIDHIRPRTAFNFTSPDDAEFKECWALKNLQPLERIANIKKSNTFYPMFVSWWSASEYMKKHCPRGKVETRLVVEE